MAGGAGVCRSGGRSPGAQYSETDSSGEARAIPAMCQVGKGHVEISLRQIYKDKQMMRKKKSKEQEEKRNYNEQ